MKLSKVGARILVDDFKLCFDFYKDILGYEVLWGDRDNVYASFKVSGDDKPAISIFKKSEMSLYDGYEDIGRQSKSDFIQLCINVDDVDECFAILKEKGVNFIGEPRNIHEWFMRCVLLRDPESNLIELSSNIK